MPVSRKTRLIRIAIADDHAIVREGLRLILSTDPTLTVVAQAEDGEQALMHTVEYRPDVLLLDLDMPKMNGLETLKRLADGHHDVKTVVLTGSIENKEIVEALKLGARGVILKQEPPRMLLKCIHAVDSGEYWVGRSAVGDLVQGLYHLAQIPESSPYGLTAREFEIIGAVLQGDTNKAVAERLAISEQTVKNHLTNVFNKLGVSNRLELALFAAKHRLVPQD